MKLNRKWKRNLYEIQNYNDNYTDPSFLNELQKNKNVKVIELKQAIICATVLNNQISCITLFLVIFHFMYTDIISPFLILILSTIVTLCGYLLYIKGNLRLHDLIENSKTLITVLVFGYIFSPLLYTLTNAVSTDTIFSVTFLVFFFNLIFFDYGLSVAIVSKAISLNSAIFGSICLASRLASSFYGFALLVVATEFFVLYPIFSQKHWKPGFVIILNIVCMYYLLNISIPVLITYVFVILFVNFICPLLFIKQQEYKNNIHGPWDEAVVKESLS